MALVIPLSALGAWLFTNRVPKLAPAPVNPYQTVLVFQGSNTVGEDLTPALARAFFQSDSASNISVGPRVNNEIVVTGSYPGEDKPRAIEIHLDGTNSAFTDLAKGAADIGMSSRKVSASEVAALASLGDMGSRQCEHVVALDGIAVIVNPANTLDSLTIPRLRDLFSGRIADWSGLSGPAGPVLIFARSQDSGTTDSFARLVMGDAVQAPGATSVKSHREVAEQVLKDPAGVGFVALPYVGGAKALRVAEPGASALLPTRFTVATEDYALSRRLYFYTAAKTKPIVRQFMAFALGPVGQQIVQDTGFVSQTIRDDAGFVPVNATPGYVNATRGARRLNTNFRFRTGSSDMDAKAWDDIDRVSAFLTAQGYQGSNILLFGFADSTGSKPFNLRLSRNRAEAVSFAFGETNLETDKIAGFGQDMPVASNDTPEGREKNRRVEIWLRK